MPDPLTPAPAPAATPEAFPLRLVYPIFHFLRPLAPQPFMALIIGVALLAGAGAAAWAVHTQSDSKKAALFTFGGVALMTWAIPMLVLGIKDYRNQSRIDRLKAQHPNEAWAADFPWHESDWPMDSRILVRITPLFFALGALTLLVPPDVMFDALEELDKYPHFAPDFVRPELPGKHWGTIATIEVIVVCVVFTAFPVLNCRRFRGSVVALPRPLALASPIKLTFTPGENLRDVGTLTFTLRCLQPVLSPVHCRELVAVTTSAPAPDGYSQPTPIELSFDVPAWAPPTALAFPIINSKTTPMSSVVRMITTNQVAGPVEGQCTRWQLDVRAGRRVVSYLLPIYRTGEAAK